MLKSVLPYVGSKVNSIEHILPNIPLDSEVYWESFCGSCSSAIALLQTRPNHFKHIVCSDVNESLISFWNYVKDTPSSFKSDYTNFLESYSDLGIKNLQPSNLVEQVFKFYFLTSCSFMFTESKGFNDERIISARKGVFRGDLNNIEELSELISPIEFKHGSYIDIFDEVKSLNKKTFCFADPPYRDLDLFQTSWYCENFVDLAIVRDKLIQFDNFVLSYNTDDIIDILFSGFTKKTIRTKLSKRAEVYIIK